MTDEQLPQKTVFRLENVAVSYRRRSGFLRHKSFWALKDISFDLYHGETLGIIGRNGVGKSTLMKVLAGIIDPEKGRVVREPCRTSLLSLNAGFLSHLTGRENVVLGGMLMGLRRHEVLAKMADILAFADIGDFIDQPVYTYSSGMKARLGFAVAYQASPEVLLIDEVLGVGDAEFKVKSTAAMKQRIKSDKTVVLVSHEFDTVRELCDRLVWIDKGETRKVGSVEEVLAFYLANSRGGGEATALESPAVNGSLSKEA